MITAICLFIIVDERGDRIVEVLVAGHQGPDCAELVEEDRVPCDSCTQCKSQRLSCLCGATSQVLLRTHHRALERQCYLSGKAR